MKTATRLLTGSLLLYLGYLTIRMATGSAPQAPDRDPPAVLWTMDLINLYLHEAGHFFLTPFGRFLHILGGSLFQVLLPLTLAALTFREAPHHAAYPLFWTGESMVNVSLYITDAPAMRLPLIAKGLVHDWNYLLRDRLDWAEPLGETVFLLGIVTCTTAIGMGIYVAVQSYRQTSPPT
jgi:hypothetical protein